MLINFASMNETVHRWIDASGLEKINESIFDYRVPIVGLPAHRTRKEEARLAFFASNDVSELPDMVFEALGLATESALTRKAKQSLDIARVERDMIALMEKQKVEAELEAQRLEKLRIEQEERERAAREAEANGEVVESKQEEVRGNVVNNVDLKKVEVKGATLDTKADDNATVTKDDITDSTSDAKSEVKEMGKTEKNRAKELKKMITLKEEHDSAARVMNILNPELVESSDSYLIAARFPSPISDVSVQQEFVSMSLQNKFNLFPNKPGMNAPLSVATEVMRTVGLDLPTSDTRRFDIWYAYMEYLGAGPNERNAKYAEFMTLTLKTHNIPLIITKEDVERISSAQEESKRIVESVAQEIAQERQKRIQAAGSKEKYLEQLDDEELAVPTPEQVEQRRAEMEGIRNEMLEGTRRERAKLLENAAPIEINPTKEDTALLKLSDHLDSMSQTSKEMRALRETIIKGEAVLRQRAVNALIDTSPFAALAREVQLNLPAEAANLSVEQAQKLKEDVIESMLARHRERALKSAAQTKFALQLEESGNSRAKLVHQLSVVSSRLEEERRNYAEQELLRERQKALLRKQSGAIVEQQLAQIESKSREHKLRRELEELEVEAALEQIEVRSEEWSDDDYIVAVQSKIEERAKKLEEEELALQEADAKLRGEEMDENLLRPSKSSKKL